MSSYSRVGVVTGANKGIGFAIVRQLALQYPKSSLNNGPLLIWYLTARDKSRGEAALEAIHKDPQLQQAKALRSDGGLTDIKFHPFDVTDKTSVKTLAEHLQAEHPNGVDFVINNAGIAMDGFNSDVVQKTLECNYFSTLSASQAFVSLLRPSGRLVNLASTAGALSKYSPEIRARFQASKSQADVDAIMREFQAAVDQGKEKEAGFPSAAYAVSKAGLIGGTRALAKEAEGKRVVSCCPGYVNTDMTKGNGTKTPDDGAKTPVWLAIGEVEGPNGAFYRDEKEVEW